MVAVRYGNAKLTFSSIDEAVLAARKLGTPLSQIDDKDGTLTLASRHGIATWILAEKLQLRLAAAFPHSKVPSLKDGMYFLRKGCPSMLPDTAKQVLKILREVNTAYSVMKHFSDGFAEQLLKDVDSLMKSCTTSQESFAKDPVFDNDPWQAPFAPGSWLAPKASSPVARSTSIATHGGTGPAATGSWQGYDESRLRQREIDAASENDQRPSPDVVDKEEGLAQAQDTAHAKANHESTLRPDANDFVYTSDDVHVRLRLLEDATKTLMDKLIFIANESDKNSNIFKGLHQKIDEKISCHSELLQAQASLVAQLAHRIPTEEPGSSSHSICWAPNYNFRLARMNNQAFNGCPGCIIDPSDMPGKWQVSLPTLGKKVIIHEIHFEAYQPKSGDTCCVCHAAINLNEVPSCSC